MNSIIDQIKTEKLTYRTLRESELQTVIDTQLTRKQKLLHKHRMIIAEPGTYIPIEQVNDFGSTIVTDFNKYLNFDPLSKKIDTDITFYPSWDDPFIARKNKKHLPYRQTRGRGKPIGNQYDPCDDPCDKTSDGIHCQTVYYHCVQKIIEYGYQIISVIKNIKAFRVRTTGVISDQRVFIFTVFKNNYQFRLTYDNNSDYSVNPLLVSKIQHVPTQTDIIGSFDLLLGQTDSYHMTDPICANNFALLLNSDTPFDYMNTIIDPYKNIPQLLQSKYQIDVVIVPDNYMVYDRPAIDLGLIFRDYQQYAQQSFQISIEELTFTINIIFESRLLVEIRTESYTNAKIGESIQVSYQSESDVDILYMNIVALQDYMKGHYGIYDPIHDCYYNDKYIYNHLKSPYNKFMNLKSFKTHEETVFEINFEHQCQDNDLYTKCDYKQRKKYYDTYQVTMGYDSTISDMCWLIIRSNIKRTFNGTFTECLHVLTELFSSTESVADTCD